MLQQRFKLLGCQKGGENFNSVHLNYALMIPRLENNP